MFSFNPMETQFEIPFARDDHWGDESVVDALKKLIPFLFRSFCNRLIFKLKKIGGTKTGSQLATLFVTFSSAQYLPIPTVRKWLSERIRDVNQKKSEV